MMAAAPQNRPITGARELLTDDEVSALVAHGGRGLLGWARRVRLESEALDALLSGDPEPSNLVPFGRRSSGVWDG